MRRKTAAREIALQALYAWQLSGGDPAEEARSLEEYQKSDFLSELLRGVPSKAPELEKLIAPHLDREFRRAHWSRPSAMLLPVDIRSPTSAEFVGAQRTCPPARTHCAC